MKLLSHTAYWQHLRSAHKTRERQDGFMRHLVGIALPIERAYRKMVTACTSQPLGYEFRNGDFHRWAFVAPSVTEPAKVLVRYFDKDGFSGHEGFANLQLAVEYMANLGFWVPDPGALKRVSATTAWSRGLIVQHWRDRQNKGELAWGDMLKEINAALQAFDMEHQAECV